jgi:hypothetical protein
MRAIDAQFVGEMQGRYALRDAAQNLDDRGTAIAGLPEECAAEQIEDRAALATAVIGNDRASPSMGRLIGRKRMVLWTVQAIWMQNTQQEVIASLFIEQTIKRKSKHWSASLKGFHLAKGGELDGILWYDHACQALISQRRRHAHLQLV